MHRFAGAARSAAALAFAGLALAGASDEAMRPGAWERTIEFISATQAGKPVEGFAPETEVKRRCVPPEAANPERMILPPQNDDCAITENRVARGVIDFSGRCSQEEGEPLIITGKGRYDPASYTMEVVTESPAEPVSAIVTMRISARHVGECAAGDEPMPGATP